MRKNWDWYVTLKKKIALNFFKKEVKKKKEKAKEVYSMWLHWKQGQTYPVNSKVWLLGLDLRLKFK